MHVDLGLVFALDYEGIGPVALARVDGHLAACEQNWAATILVLECQLTADFVDIVGSVCRQIVDNTECITTVSLILGKHLPIAL